MSEASILDLINQWLVDHDYRRISSLRAVLSSIIRKREHQALLTHLSEQTGLNIPEGYETFDPSIKDIVNLLLTQYGFRNGLHHRSTPRRRDHHDRKQIELR